MAQRPQRKRSRTCSKTLARRLLTPGQMIAKALVMKALGYDWWHGWRRRRQRVWIVWYRPFNGFSAGCQLWWRWLYGNGSRSGGVDGKGGFPAVLHPQRLWSTITLQWVATPPPRVVEEAVIVSSTVINNVEYVTTEQAMSCGRG